ncbi:MAG: universal stress protein [Saprospiraceae bacterium]|nr:universal stress protein [Saprospiraceae bacterium]MBK8669765.1 universal stress protein [Saprospiraceae bacterium]
MIDIKIYGTGTPSYQLAKSKLMENLSGAGMEYHLEEITKITDIINDNIESVPAVRVNDKLLFEIKPNGSYNRSLRETIQNILRIDNYGKMTKIIVPTDFSEASFNAYNYANHLAKDLEGVLLLTHIYYPTSTDVNQFVVVNEEAEKIHRDKLDKYVKSVNQDWIGNFITEPLIEGVFKVGFPRMELTEMSRQPNTIMVMGTTGEGDTFKKVFGSLSMDMIDHSYCPLFLIPPGATYADSKEIIYLSEDLKNDSLHILYAGRMCVKTGSDFRLVHFRSKENDEYDVTDTIKIMESYFPEVKYHIEIMDTTDLFGSIKDLVSRDAKNLIVLSTKHRNIFQNIFHRSVTEFAALHSVSPLLILSDKTIEG